MKKFILIACAIMCLPGIRDDTCPLDSMGSPEECVQPVLECPNSNISFYLYTPSSRSPLKLDEQSLANAPIEPGSPLKLLIHDYRGGRDDNFNAALRAAYWRRGDYNVLSVDYAPLAREPCYEQGALNARLVAVCVADLLDSLADSRGLRSDALHVVGFGFGAHIAGLCTNCLRAGRVGRITGLDPSLRMFSEEDAATRLDAGDAVFVDVIHTNAGRLGQVRRLGDVDFYVNGGVEQPGCDKTTDVDLCSHHMAPVYFAESITTPHGFWGTTCREACGRKLGLPRRGKTPRVAMLMGEDVSVSAYGMLCVDTTCKAPYAKGRCDNKKSHTFLYDLGGIVMVIIFLYFTIRYFYSSRSAL